MVLQSFEAMTSPPYPRAREVALPTQLRPPPRVRTGVPRPATTPLVLAATLACLLAFGGVAAGAAPYTLKLKVPRYVNVGQTFRVKATGTSGSRSRISVFLARKRCATSAAAESNRAVRTLISKNVLHRYASSKVLRAGTGTYNVCAYLTSIGHSPVTRARASATYYVLAGGY